MFFCSASKRLFFQFFEFHDLRIAPEVADDRSGRLFVLGNQFKRIHVAILIFNGGAELAEFQGICRGYRHGFNRNRQVYFVGGHFRLVGRGFGLG